MKKLLRVVATVVACAFWLANLVEARKEGTGGATEFYQASPQQIASPAGTLLKFEEMRTPAFFRGRIWRILYSTRNAQMHPTLASGVVVLPDYAAKNPAERTIVAWAHPTVGIARSCAPSLKKNPLPTILGINALVSAGHIVVAPDYPGLGTRSLIGYLVGRDQGFATLDAVRAARQIPSVGGGKRYALWGYSQGGHAALFASAVSTQYAPELQLVGTAAIAPPTNLGQLLKDDLNTLEGRVLTSFALGSWSLRFGVPLGTVAAADAVPHIKNVNSTCIDDLAGKLDVLSAQKPLTSSFLAADPLAVLPWRDLLTNNSITGLGRGSATLVLQGTEDKIVRPYVTQAFVRWTCRNGGNITYVPLAANSHGGSAKAGAPTAIQWINARFKGVSSRPASCR